MRAISLFCGVVLLLCLTLPLNAWAASQPVARVISLQAGVTVERNGKSLPLALKDPIYLQDTVRTDQTGKAQLIFTDDTSVTVGNATVFAMSEFAEAGNKSTFKGNLFQGFARVITGRVVENNPAGFTVTTPEATIGIRGTIFTAQRSEGRTTVAVENTMKGQVYVNNVQVPAGFQTTVSPTDRIPAPRPMTPADRQLIINQNTIARGNTQQDGQDGQGGQGGTGQLAESAPPGSAPTPGTGSDLSAEPLALVAMGNTNALGSGNATVSGTLHWAGSGSFSFGVNLMSGNISNASMSGSNGAGGTSFNLSGGSGGISSGGYHYISGFGGTVTTSGGGTTVPGASTHIGGIRGLTLGGSVSGNFNVYQGIGSIAGGTISGTVN